MKTIYQNKHVRVSIPSTKTDWIVTFLVFPAIVSIINGDGHGALLWLNTALLVAILGEKP